MATNFLFNSTKSILCGVGSSRTLGEVFKSLGCVAGQQLLFVTDKGLQDANLGGPCIEQLQNQGFDVNVYSGVVADPPEANILEAVEMSKKSRIAGVVGFGGGSSMDVAKLVAFLSHKDCQQSISDIYGVGMCKGSRLPLIQVPTTAGTGSEVTPISIITTGANEKKGIVSPQLLPDCAVLDGELTTSLPAHITAATGIDAMVHAIEAYTTKLKKNPLSDILARDALRLLGDNIRTVCSTEGAANAQARGDMLLGSLYAGMAFANAPVGAVHALAYPIGSHFHVPHGLSNSLMLPHVLRFNAARSGGVNQQDSLRCASYYSDLASISFKQHFTPSSTEDVYENAEQFAQLFEALARELALPQRLRDVNIQANDIALLSTEAMKQTRLLPNNAREVTKSDAINMYEAAY